MGPHREPSSWLPWQWAEWDLLTNNPKAPIKTGPQDGTGRTLIYDAEGDGILHADGGKKAVTQFWCIAAIDADTEEEFYWGVDLGPESIAQGVRFLQQANILIAHHGIGYDFPATERLYPWFTRPAKSWDSLVIAKCIWPAESLIGGDLKLIRAGRMPAQLMKRHSLEAWGCRTGQHKDEFGKGVQGKFDEWCPAMAPYLMDDVRSLLALWRLMLKRLGWKDAVPGQLVWPEETIITECAVARIIHEQTEYGVRFNVPEAVVLASQLRNEQSRIEADLVETFGSWWQPLDDPEQGREAGSTIHRKLTGCPDVTIRRFGKNGKELKPYVGPPLEEITKGSKSVRIEYTTFNPSSRAHIAQRLTAVFGWKPKAFGKDGVPTMDETTLEEIPEAVMPKITRQLLLDYFVVTKTLGTLSKGRLAWLALCKEESGRVHGQMDTVGTVTRRGTHKNPNLSGTPAVMKEKDPNDGGKEHPVKGLKGRYGWECRALFEADDGDELTGVDASSLELIDLGSYLWPHDKGAFSARVCDPKRDAHQEHADLMGGGTLRDDAKTTIYLKVYGGSAYKLSLALDVTDDEVPSLLTYKGLPMLLKALARRFDEDFVQKLDDRQKARISKARQIIIKLENGIEGLKDLIEAIQGAASRGWLKAMDGSRIIVRKPHAALNSLLQSAGAVSCKLWMRLFHEEMARRGYVKRLRPYGPDTEATPGDWAQVLWVHDELQITHRPGLGPVIKEVAEECLVKAGVMLGLRGRYRTAGKTGRTWAECH